MKYVRRYLSLWVKLTLNSFLVSLSSRFGATLFLTGKLMRFGLFGLFLAIIFTRSERLSDYGILQVLFFYLTFNLIDTTTQLFFREVYRFRHQVVSGDFDLTLVKPMSPLFRALAGGADPLDLVMLIPYIGSLIYIGSQLGSGIAAVMTYLLLLANGLLIATGFHILVLALAIVTTEIDHTIMIYRDLTSMGRVPVDIYREPLRSLVTFVIPVGIMMTFPVKAFLGLLSLSNTLLSLILGGLFFVLCLRVWRLSLSRYASASS